MPFQNHRKYIGRTCSLEQYPDKIISQDTQWYVSTFIMLEKASLTHDLIDIYIMRVWNIYNYLMAVHVLKAHTISNIMYIVYSSCRGKTFRKKIRLGPPPALHCQPSTSGGRNSYSHRSYIVRSVAYSECSQVRNNNGNPKQVIAWKL